MFKSLIVATALLLGSVAYAGPVNINTASAGEIATHLTGIGPKKAERIVQYRERLGGFTQVRQLLEVKGIGEKTLAKNREHILLGR